MLYVLAPAEAVAVTLILSLVSIVQGLWTIRLAVIEHRLRLARFLMPALFGLPLGAHLLPFVSAETIKLFIGVIFLTYGGIFSARRTLPNLRTAPRLAEWAVGFGGGILGGLAGLAGALPTMWASLRPWSKAEVRALLQPFNFVVLGLTALILAGRGVYTVDLLFLTLLCLPASIIATQFGLWSYARLSSDVFRRLIILLMFVSGAAMLGEALI